MAEPGGLHVSGTKPWAEAQVGDVILVCSLKKLTSQKFRAEWWFQLLVEWA